MSDNITKDLEKLIADLEKEGLTKEAQGLRNRFRDMRDKSLERRQNRLKGRFSEGQFQGEAGGAQKARLRSLQQRQIRNKNVMSTSQEMQQKGMQGTANVERMITRLRELGYTVSKGDATLSAAQPPAAAPAAPAAPAASIPETQVETEAPVAATVTGVKGPFSGISSNYKYKIDFDKKRFILVNSKGTAVNIPFTDKAKHGAAHNKLVAHFSTPGKLTSELTAAVKLFGTL